ncbi:MAG: hypothetical protein QF721_07755 [Verrucomicrobiota bacterium]|jgi:hypothetical protein|nr:hypothetical protein [Verrucomicrobiota bacterium]
MNRLKLPVLAAVALVVAGCQTTKRLAHDGQASIFRPELWLKDGLYYAAGADEPYTGKHEAWFANGDKAWEGEMKDGVRHGPYTQWHSGDGGLHVAGLYQDGNRNGTWGQWYRSGQSEITSEYLEGIESKVTFYSEQGEVIPERLYWRKLRQKLSRQGLGSYSIAHRRGYTSYDYPSFYQGSSGWTPPGGGSASDFGDLRGNRSSFGGGSPLSGGGSPSGGGSVGAPEGQSSDNPKSP